MPVYEPTYPNAYFIGDLAEQLGSGYRTFPAWYVKDASAKGRPERVTVTRLRGPLDRHQSGHDYAELEGGRVVPSLYLFPQRGFTKPRFLAMQDAHGVFHNWVGLRRGYKPPETNSAEFGAAPKTRRPTKNQLDKLVQAYGLKLASAQGNAPFQTQMRFEKAFQKAFDRLYSKYADSFDMRSPDFWDALEQRAWVWWRERPFRGPGVDW